MSPSRPPAALPPHAARNHTRIVLGGNIEPFDALNSKGATGLHSNGGKGQS